MYKQPLINNVVNLSHIMPSKNNKIVHKEPTCSGIQNMVAPCGMWKNILIDTKFQNTSKKVKYNRQQISTLAILEDFKLFEIFFFSDIPCKKHYEHYVHVLFQSITETKFFHSQSTSIIPSNKFFS